MPGAYTHITMSNVAGERRSLRKIAGFPKDAIIACGQFDRYCELGSVSPDYPYLNLLSDDAKVWADTMHYERTGDVIKAGVRRVRQMHGDQQKKCLAWLLGYAAHVTMDVTIHPVINLRVGEYEANKTQHRICEMNQDVYIFHNRMNLKLGLAEHLDQGIGRCSNAAGAFDEDISALWAGILAEVHPDQFAGNRPEPADWHSWFKRAVDGIAESNFLSAISRHIAPNLGLAYPPLDALDETFIEALEVPGGKRMHFDDIFEKAKDNVQRIWLVVSNGALGISDEFEDVLGYWNLDTGLDAATNKFVFWDA